MRNYYKSGDWNAICDRCGFKFKASQLQEDWQGFRVCKDDFEMRHPQDFIRARIDKIYVPWVRPEFADPVVAVDVRDCYDYINGGPINCFGINGLSPRTITYYDLLTESGDAFLLEDGSGLLLLEQ